MRTMPALLLLSLAANGVLGFLLWREMQRPSAEAGRKNPAVMVDINQFDFSDSPLSDEAATIPAPELSPPHPEDFSKRMRDELK